MVLPTLEEPVQTLNLVKEIEIDAPAAAVFESLLEPAGKFAEMGLKIEPWPGGRWYRDLGNNTGHLWGHVQVIKPPLLLEFYGPMMMSYPAVSHVQYRVVALQGGKSLLRLTHRALGLLTEEHMKGLQEGWGMLLETVKSEAEERAAKAA